MINIRLPLAPQFSKKHGAGTEGLFDCSSRPQPLPPTLHPTSGAFAAWAIAVSRQIRALATGKEKVGRGGGRSGGLLTTFPP